MAALHKSKFARVLFAAIYSGIFAFSHSSGWEIPLYIPSYIYWAVGALFFTASFFTVNSALVKPIKIANPPLLIVFSLLASFFAAAHKKIAYALYEGAVSPLKDVAVSSWSIIDFLAILLFFALYFVFLLAVENCLRHKFPFPAFPRNKNSKIFFLFFAIITFCWSVAFVLAGPVRLSPDSNFVVNLALTGELNDSHPLLYTFILKLFLELGLFLGNIEIGAILFGFSQMIFFSFAASSSLYFIYRKGAPRWLCFIGTAYFALSATFAVNSFTVWKDTPFNAMLLLFCVFLYEIVQSGGELLQGKKGLLKYCLFSLFICFLRGNGWLIILIISAILAGSLCRKNARFCVVAITLLVFVKIITVPVYDAIGVKNMGVVENSGIALQQVARAVKYSAKLNSEQDAFLRKIMPLERMSQVYLGTSVNLIKGNADFDNSFFIANYGEFISLWLQLAPANLQEYVNAWLLGTAGYWNFSVISPKVNYSNEFNGNNGIYEFQIPIVEELNLKKLLFESSIFFPNIAVNMWSLLFAVYFMVITNRKKFIIVLLPAIAVWLGLMVAAPIYLDYRYLMISALILPLAFFTSIFHEPIM